MKRLFVRLLVLTAAAGVFQVPQAQDDPQQRYSVGEQMRRVLRIARQRTSDEMINRVEFLSAWG
jgi:hypothetical protein